MEGKGRGRGGGGGKKVGGRERACQIRERGREGGREGGLLSHPCTACNPLHLTEPLLTTVNQHGIATKLCDLR